MNQTQLFEKTKPIKLFFLAAVPGAVSMLAASLYGLLDGVFVGRILGEAAFAALNLAFPFVVINFSLADLIGVGSSVPIAIALGKKQDCEANNIFTCACLMIVITGTLMGALMYFLAPVLIALLGAQGELAALAVQYMRVYALCAPVTTIVFAMDNYLRICGKIRKSMWLNIFMSFLSAALEFVFLGVLGWGVWGAALATSGGMFVCALIALYPFARGKLQLRFCRPRFTARLVRKIVGCGSPNFLNNIAGQLTAILFNTVLMGFGGAAAVSVYGVLAYTQDTFQSFFYGICDSLQPAVGYNRGAGQKKRVKALEKCCYTATALVSLAAAALMLLFPETIVRLFVKAPSEGFMQTAILAMRLFSLTFVTRWFSFATQSFMTAVGKPAYASVLSVSTALVLPIVLVAALWPLGLTGIWLNFPATYAVAAVLAVVILLRFRKEWRTLPDEAKNA